MSGTMILRMAIAWLLLGGAVMLVMALLPRTCKSCRHPISKSNRCGKWMCGRCRHCHRAGSATSQLRPVS